MPVTVDVVKFEWKVAALCDNCPPAFFAQLFLQSLREQSFFELETLQLTSFYKNFCQRYSREISSAESFIPCFAFEVGSVNF